MIGWHHWAVVCDLPEVFTVAQALSWGLSRSQLLGSRFSRVFRGVYTTGDPNDITTRAQAALLIGGTGALLGSVTVLRLMGVWLPSPMRDDQRIHVVVPASRDGSQVSGIVIERAPIVLPPVEVINGVHGIHPAQAWLQLACHISETELVIVTDALMYRGRKLASRDDLQHLLQRLHRRRCVIQASAALNRARPGVRSPMETRLRLALVNTGLPCPEVDFALRPHRDSTCYRLSMAYPSAHIGVEFDNTPYSDDSGRWHYDRTRRREIEDAGWRLITATAKDFQNLGPLVASVKAALKARSPETMRQTSLSRSVLASPSRV